MQLKDIAFPLRVAIRAKLLPLGFPVFDAFVADDTIDQFIVIKDINEADDSLKTGFNSDVHVTLDLVTRFNHGTGSSSLRDSMSSSVSGLLIPNTLTLTDWNIMSAIRTVNKPIDEEYKTQKILRKLIIIKYNVQQLN